MKNIILILALIIFTLSNSQAQITPASGDLLITDTLELSPLHPWIEIPDPSNNIWQVGSPQKSFFNASYQNETPILTDTINTYPIHINNYFQITFPIFDSLYGEVNLSFYHKYDTDSLIDGGIIELSYDGGISWINIKNDIDHFNYNFIKLTGGSIDRFQNVCKEIYGHEIEFKFQRNVEKYLRKHYIEVFDQQYIDKLKEWEMI
jgi:hypothetical protein